MSERLKYEVRPADKVQDNKELCALSARTPMMSEADVIIDRLPDFFAFYDLHGDFNMDLTEDEKTDQTLEAYTCTVALHEGRIVGVLAIAVRNVRFGGKIIRLAYPMDARVAPEYQRKGVMKAIGMFLPGAYSETQVDCIMGVILRGNVKALSSSKKTVPQYFIGRPAGEFHLVQFSMYWPYRENKELEIEQATEDDLDEIAALLDDFYKDHTFAPVMDRPWLDRTLERSKGYSVSDISVVRRNGRIVALVGLWDQSPVRRIIVQRNTWPIRIGIFLARILHLFIPSPVPPSTGKPMRSLYIKHIACLPGCEDVLQDMMKILLNRVRRGRQYHFVWGAFFHNSPLLPLWKGFMTTRSHSQIVFAPWNTGWDADPEQIKSKSAFLDFSMV